MTSRERLWKLKKNISELVIMK